MNGLSVCCTRGLRAAFWCCLVRHQKSGASAAMGVVLFIKNKIKKKSMLYSRFASSVLVLPSATPEERSERGLNDQTVAARVLPRHTFGDRDTF
ncbi:hypothetical protein NDU88_002223 [Pleurodeles waltl]|uniref:Secreted protein n=1 Tax=Pleurodeles waltl TaxID=8319 RepID=A0AAV7TKH8_PLEWA|nr:hypothetical protein NDU88_002223 [Pleurodeles waltl]